MIPVADDYVNKLPHYTQQVIIMYNDYLIDIYTITQMKLSVLTYTKQKDDKYIVNNKKILDVNSVLPILVLKNNNGCAYDVIDGNPSEGRENS